MKISKPITESEAFFKVTSLCANSEQCEWNIREKLTKWGIESEVSDRIINRLYEENYLDELRFACAYSHDKLRYNHWGRLKINQGLLLLHISSTVRREALQSLPEEEYMEILRHILLTKLKTIKTDNAYERNAKIIRFALQRGFETNLVMKNLPPDDCDEALLSER